MTVVQTLTHSENKKKVFTQNACTTTTLWLTLRIRIKRIRLGMTVCLNTSLLWEWHLFTWNDCTTNTLIHSMNKKKVLIQNDFMTKTLWLTLRIGIKRIRLRMTVCLNTSLLWEWQLCSPRMTLYCKHSSSLCE
jgi:hypothetical protein